MSDTGARASTEGTEGEAFSAMMRLVVAPVSGSFQPSAALAAQPAPVPIARGQVIGHVTGTAGRVEVTSPFAGDLDTVIAWPDERVVRHQRVAALRMVG